MYTYMYIYYVPFYLHKMFGSPCDHRRRRSRRKARQVKQVKCPTVALSQEQRLERLLARQGWQELMVQTTKELKNMFSCRMLV